MGNFCSGSSKPDTDLPDERDDFPPPQTQEQNVSQTSEQPSQTTTPDIHDQEMNNSPATSITPFLGTPDRPSSSPPNQMTTPAIGPRLFSLLEFFRELHIRKEDLYEQVIPAHREAFKEIFTTMGAQMKQRQQKKHDKMGHMDRQRSRSVGDADELRLEAFKVKPIGSGGTPPGPPPSGTGGKGGTGPTKPGGSK